MQVQKSSDIFQHGYNWKKSRAKEFQSQALFEDHSRISADAQWPLHKSYKNSQAEKIENQLKILRFTQS